MKDLDQSAVLQFGVSKSGIGDVSMIPIRIDACRPRLCTNEEAVQVLERLKLYSKDMGASIERDGEKALIQ